MSIAAILIAAVVPFGSDALVNKIPVHQLTANLRSSVQEDQVRLDALRRGYEDALDHCRNQIRQGQEVTCPDFNDVGSYIEFAREYGYDGESTNETQSEAVTARTKARLRAFVRRGRCPGFLKGALATMCADMLAANQDVPTVGELGGFLNPRAAAAQKKTVEPTLRDRVDQVRQARDRSLRRKNFMRPTTKRVN